MLSYFNSICEYLLPRRVAENEFIQGNAVLLKESVSLQFFNDKIPFIVKKVEAFLSSTNWCLNIEGTYDGHVTDFSFYEFQDKYMGRVFDTDYKELYDAVIQCVPFKYEPPTKPNVSLLVYKKKFTFSNPPHVGPMKKAKTHKGLLAY